ncbi:MAG: hypothetical protein VCF07_10290 [Nitrospinota bacterium]
MALQCCVCEDILIEAVEMDKLHSSKRENKVSKVSSGYCLDCFGRLVGSAIGVHAEKAAA